MKRNSLVMLYALAVVSASCGNSEPLKFQEYMKWLDNPENGCVQTRRSNGVELTMKAIPVDYRVYQDLRMEPTVTPEKLRNARDQHRHSITFMLSIVPIDEDSEVMMTGVSNYDEYEEKVMTLNFQIAEYVKLRAGGKEYRPVVSALDNDYGAGRTRRITMVFVDDNDPTAFAKADNYDLIFSDIIFQTGMNHFVFDRKSYDACPELHFPIH